MTHHIKVNKFQPQRLSAVTCQARVFPSGVPLPPIFDFRVNISINKKNLRAFHAAKYVFAVRLS